MGYDLLAAIFFVAMTPMVIVGFIAFWVMNARDHEELAGTWRAYAKKRGLGFVEPAREWPNRTPPVITWSEGSAELRISAIGREADVRTRLTVRPRGALLGVLVMTAPEQGTDFHVTERPGGFSRRLVTERVRRALLGFRQRDKLVIRYKRGALVLDWPGGERNDARLDEARRLGQEMAAAIEAEFAGVANAHEPAA